MGHGSVIAHFHMCSEIEAGPDGPAFFICDVLLIREGQKNATAQSLLPYLDNFKASAAVLHSLLSEIIVTLASPLKS